MQLSSLIGKKLYQKQGFLQDGTRVPLSGVRVFGNVIAQVKSADKEGYNAVQLGIETKKKPSKSLLNHSKKAGIDHTPAFLREIRVDDVTDVTAGTEINPADIFAPGDIVDVTGISKGKGFAGGVKRWGFHGGPRTHGQSDRERAPGSIGQTTTPGRVYKGKRMAGRMGQETVTVKNLEVIEVTNDGVLLIRGLVPGSVNTIVVIKKMGTNKKFVPLYKEITDEAISGDGAGSSSSSDDAKPVAEETPSSEPTSLNDSSAPVAEEKQVVEPEPTVSSSEGEQAPAASQDGSVSSASESEVSEQPAVAQDETIKVEAPVEVKIEASEVPPMQDEPATTIEDLKEKTKIGDENANS
jgi:large subunit ribosomal protein L3